MLRLQQAEIFSLYRSVFKLKYLSSQQLNKKNNQKDKTVAIVGSGIIGITSAFRLLEEGYKVILLEKESSVATQTSYHNGCVFTPYHFKPLVNRKNASKFFKSWFSSDKNYHLNLSVMLENNFWRWLVNAILLSMTEHIDIGDLTHKEVERLRKQHPSLFIHQLLSKGQLGLMTDENSLLDYTKVLDKFQIPYDTIRDCKQLEKVDPQLVNDYNRQILSQFKVGLLMTSEISLDTFEYCKNAVQTMQNQYKGQFQINFNCEVEDFVLQDQQCIALRIKDGQTIKADQFLLATSSDIRQFNQKLKVHFPILPVQGWTVGIPNSHIKFQEEHHLFKYLNVWTSNAFCVPIMDSLRLAGIASVTRQDKNKLDYWGSKSLLSQFVQMSKGEINEKNCKYSTCFRPITPDDGAIISRLPNYKNIYCNNGHGSKGTSHCFGAAQILLEIMEDQTKEEKWKQFNIDRFYML